MSALRTVSTVAAFAVGVLAANPAFAQGRIQVLPASPINCGAPPVNMTNMVTVSINNIGNANLSINSITQPAAPFSVTGVPPLPIALAPGTSFSFSLDFTPTAQGNFASTFSIGSNDPNAPNTVVTVTGSAGNPTITLDAAAVAFGDQRVGLASMPFTVNISNTGMGDLHIAGFVVGGTNPGDFSVMTPATPFTVSPGQTQSFGVSFKPQALGARSGTVIVQSNDANAPSKLVSLLGTGVMANLSCAPPNLGFNTQTEFLASSPQTITCTNSGNGDAFVTGVVNTGAQATSFVLSAPPTFPARVGANNGTLVLNVVAVPLAPGANAAVMHIQYDDPMKPEDTVNLTVTGVAGHVMVSPSLVDFGAVPINTVSPPVSITVTNSGTAALTISNALINDMNNAFSSNAVSAFQTRNMPLVIAPGATTSFDVEFSPQVAMQFSASLDLTTDDPMAHLVRIPLLGTGSTIGVSVSPMTLSFPDTLVDGVAGPQPITITNTGGAPLTVQSLALGGTAPQDFQIDQTGPFSLDGGKSQTVQVTFQPLTGGKRSATLTVSFAGGLPAAVVMLGGTALTPMLAVAPPTLDFGMVTVGTPSDPLTVGMKNGGTSTLVLTSIGASNSAFIVDTSGIQMTLAAGASTTFQVHFVPPAVGPKSGAINITTRGGTFSVTASGTGVAAPAPPHNGCSTARPSTPSLPPALLALAGALLLAPLRRALRRR
jgi:hypothetical protein